MGRPFHATVYEGCEVEIIDGDAFRRNPLYQNPLVELKHPDEEDDAFWTAHTSSRWNPEASLVDVCVRCDEHGFGPLCRRHLAELQAGTP